MIYYPDDGHIAYRAAYNNTGVTLYVGTESTSQCLYSSYGGNNYNYYSDYFTKSSFRYKTSAMNFNYSSGEQQDQKDINNNANSLLNWAFTEFNNYSKSKVGVTMKQLGFTNWDK